LWLFCHPRRWRRRGHRAEVPGWQVIGPAAAGAGSGRQTFADLARSGWLAPSRTWPDRGPAPSLTWPDRGDRLPSPAGATRPVDRARARGGGVREMTPGAR
jgi:hypothetical protein